MRLVTTAMGVGAGVAVGVGLWFTRASLDFVITAAGRSGRDPGWALAPLLILPILALPHAPRLPDWIPALVTLAGPLRYFVWAVALALTAWGLVARGETRWSPPSGGLSWANLKVGTRGGGFHRSALVLLVGVTLFGAASGALPLRISVVDGFTPAAIDPAGTDRRFLGCWIEFEAPGGS